MRTCSKTTCSEPAAATIVLRYERRQVAMVELLPERDPNHMELCLLHADRLVPPVGWVVQDERRGAEIPQGFPGLDPDSEALHS